MSIKKINKIIDLVWSKKMKLKERVSIEEILGAKFKIRTFEPLEYGEAALTHFIHNAAGKESQFYLEGALNHVKTFLSNTEGKENLNSIVSEDALQGLLFQDQDELPFKAPRNPKFKFIDLFAGIGGFRLAFQSLGGKCVFTSEWDEQAKKTYRTNFGEIPFGDITKEETKKFIPDDFDVLCAGFPCQAFSIAGKRGGFEDTRGTLFFDVAEIIRRKRPKAFFLENVKGLVNHDKGRTLSTILNTLREDLGYFVPNPKVMNAKDFGVPQNRERIFIVGFREDLAINDFEYPEPIKETVAFEDVKEETPVSVKYYLSNQY